MNFVTFPVGAINVFPAANSTSGSQLVTEWNLRSREMVSTNSEVQYQIGPSFVHGMEDFEVTLFTDESGNLINSYTIKISEGRAVINGHYVETLTPMSIDLVEANVKLKQQSREPLKGQLAVGFRAFYATEETVAGSLLVEDGNDMFLGIQTVILPQDQFITPDDSPDDQSKVTADIRIATFNFVNNNITSIVNLDSKLRYLNANRISQFESIISSQYISKRGLNSKKLYAFAGKGKDPETGFDTWEDVTDSMMVWDDNPVRTSVKPTYKEAAFVTSGDAAYLVMPHKKVEGMTDDNGNPEYYASKIIELPTADYSSNTPGIVNKDYTKQIKRISDKVEEFRSTLTGKQIYFMETKDDDTALPSINPAWSIGDYILVSKDNSGDVANDGVRAPSTMYVILPGIVQTILYKTTVEDSDDVPASLTGVELGLLEWSEAKRQSEPETEDPEFYPEFFTEDDAPRGIPNVDYFRLRYVYNKDDQGVVHYKNYYYVVNETGKREWSNYIWVTGEIPLADDTTIGGFLNASEDLTDYGYVTRDSTGHLRLIDYGLLRSGTLAYQLAEDLTLPSGVSTAEIQTYIAEYVNQRVAFPDQNQLDSGSPNIIHIYMSLVEEEEEEEAQLNFADIDSRFNTAVCLHISGSATSTTTINIYDCQKIMIDPNIEGSPIINVYRSNLYYDASVINYIRTCEREVNTETTFTGLENISFWYQRYEDDDPNLVVDHMTISELDAPVVPSETDYWKEQGTAVNDNHYLFALKSITFADNADIVGCGLLVANNSTDNIDPGEKIIVGDFTLPQGSGLIYPQSCLVKPLKVTGTFTTAYFSDSMWYMTDTSFACATNINDPYDSSIIASGNIAYHSKTTLVPSTLSQTSIPVWDCDAYHLFFGGTIGG